MNNQQEETLKHEEQHFGRQYPGAQERFEACPRQPKTREASGYAEDIEDFAGIRGGDQSMQTL